MSITTRSADPSYGVSATNPVRLGGPGNDLTRAARFLSALRGPGGERVTYERIGVCCGVERPLVLDVYRVSYPGQKDPVTVYINLEATGERMVPAGLSSL